jgi:signal transduction histidine kinase
MSATSEFKREYATALGDYLDGDGETSLEKAYELGRRAVKDGVGVLELAGIYGAALADRLDGPSKEIARRGSRFLLESLSSFEMTHRGFREANEALRDLNETLEKRVAERTDEAEQARVEAENANRAKADFLAVMSHELRTPLNAVLGYTDLLAAGIAGPLTEKQASHLERIRVSANHLLELIEEVLAFAKIDPDRERIEITQVDLAALMTEVAELIEPLAVERGLDLRVETPPENGTVRSDPKRLRQILMNLLSNAVKSCCAERSKGSG